MISRLTSDTSSVTWIIDICALCAFAVRYKPLDTQASVGLTKCINALTGMEVSDTFRYPQMRHLHS